MIHLYRYTQDDIAEARRQFAAAIAIAPELGPAYSATAEAYYYEVVYGFAESVTHNRERAIEFAQKAVALDRDDAGAHCTLGRTRYLRREYAAAISERKTLDLNRAPAHYGLGAAFVFSGKPREAFTWIAIGQSQDPNMGSYLARIAGPSSSARMKPPCLCAARFGATGFRWSRYAILIAALGPIGTRRRARRYLTELTRMRQTSASPSCATCIFSRDMGADRYEDCARPACRKARRAPPIQ
jgi:tetratricopeptide (TPR) repeat protein